ncbi:SKA complex subunit 1-like [Saccoglossus kowalevskii]|uniref:SKA complex subunit 1 n=1 Tax=Saccoglossus kowalevskii TaxID=10224 RepID=A0ABM0GQL2_SACKO|nr:PREDICTED: spindle and kinetochore-associated protein 1-like [Saccoglossus kowalevskii]
MDSHTLEELGDYFTSKTANIRKCMELHGCGNEPNCHKLLKSLDMELIAAEDILSEMKKYISVERRKLTDAQELMNNCNDLLQNTLYMSKHLPDHLPGTQKKNADADNFRGSKLVEQSSQISQVTPEEVTSKMKKKKQVNIPKMNYITMEEFESVPKYMKGRHGYDGINNIIDAINRVLETKYKMMSQSRKTASDKVVRQCREWKQQQNKDSQGLSFFVDDDYKKMSDLKFDKATCGVFTILRHCNRMKEVRGGGITRYCLNEW